MLGAAGRALTVGLALAAAGCSTPRSAPVAERPLRDVEDYVAAAPAPATEAGKPIARHNESPSAAARDADWRPDSYVVKRGDTLYSIALDHGLAYRDVAAWNKLADPNLIKVGQTLKLVPPPGWADQDAGTVLARPMEPAPALEVKPLEPAAPIEVKTAPKAMKEVYSPEALARMRNASVAASPAAERSTEASRVNVPPVAAPSTPSKPAPLPSPPSSAAAERVATAEVDGVRWAWPARGKLLHAFGQGENAKGVAIAGDEGQPILASAPGKVVYAGSGLRGYGKLIILKHNDTYLSVYAHNRALLVQEGDWVNGGQRIAEMGRSDATQIGLHFEIRRLGKPVDPMKFLPAQEQG